MSSGAQVLSRGSPRTQQNFPPRRFVDLVTPTRPVLSLTTVRSLLLRRGGVWLAPLRASMEPKAVAAPLPFPPAPPSDEASAELSALMPLSQHVTALALGGARLIGVMGRHEVHGEERRCAIRAPHGAYLRVVRAPGGGSEWTVLADGEHPSDPACVFVLQKGGVARHLKATIRNAEKSTLVASSRGGELRAARVVANGLAGSAEEEERWRVEASPLGGGAVSLQNYYDSFLSANSSGYVCARAPRAGVRQSFWLCNPEREQQRCDEYRAACAVMTTPLPPPSDVAADAAAPDSPLSSVEGDEAREQSVEDEQLLPAELKRRAALRDAAAATQRATAALAQAEAEAAAAERFAAAARERWAVATIALHDAEAREQALRDGVVEPDDWVPISVPPGA